MTWYWDSVHFTAAAGDLVLARMFGATGRGMVPPADFGVRLNGGVIEEVLAAKRAARAVYAALRPEEVTDVVRLVQTAEASNS